LGLIVQSVNAIFSRSASTIDSTFAALKKDDKEISVSGDTFYYICVELTNLCFESDCFPPTAEDLRQCRRFAILAWILSPIWVPIAVVVVILYLLAALVQSITGGLRTTTTSKANDWLSCKVEEFSCQNNVLSKALSAI
jgi:hypothetical protein